jgi:hypothetical protein
MVDIREIAKGSGLLIVCSGDFDLKELYEAKINLQDRFPSISSWYFAVVDLSNVAQLNVSAADFDRLVELDRRLSRFTRPGLPVAIIARGELPFGVSRMWQSSTDPTGWDSRVFRDRISAEAWLRDRVSAVFSFAMPALHLERASASSSG